MKPGTCRTLASLLLFGFFTACILAQITPARVQAVSFFVKDGPKQEQIFKAQVVEKQENEGAKIRYEAVKRRNIQFEQLSKNAVRMALLLKRENQSITVLLTGDLMCLGGQQRAVKKGANFDFSASFAKVKLLLSQADLCIGNLETLISPSNPYTIDKNKVVGNPNCNAMESYLAAIKNAGFDAVATANNHCLDALEEGVMETLRSLDQYGLFHTGTCMAGTERQILMFHKNGITIALLSYTELINRRDELPTETVDAYVDCYSKERVLQDVLNAREQGADVIIAYNHWGTENTHNVTKRQEEHAKEMAEAGVDIIIGPHPHCLQRAEYITTSSGKKVLCMYSMGNFISSMTKEINSDTIALQLTVTKQDTVLIEAGYYAMKSITCGKERYVLMLTADDKENNSLDIKLKDAHKRIQTVIGTEIKELMWMPELASE